MANKRITELNLHTSPQLSDVIAIVNNNETKKTTYGSLYYGIRDGLVSGSSQIDITQTQNYGNVMITGSLSDGTLTFTKGDSSTFDIDLESVFTKHAYLSCYSSASQDLIASGSEQAATFTSVWTTSGVSLINNDTIRFIESGVYKLTFTAQVANSDNAVHDSYFWVKYKGNNFPYSTKRATLPARKNSTTPSGQVITIDILGVALDNNDEIQLYWTGDSTTLSLRTLPNGGGVPESPSIMASIVRIA